MSHVNAVGDAANSGILAGGKSRTDQQTVAVCLLACVLIGHPCLESEHWSYWWCLVGILANPTTNERSWATTTWGGVSAKPTAATGGDSSRQLVVMMRKLGKI